MLQELQNLLEVNLRTLGPNQLREWFRRICELSREYHLNVWYRLLPKDEVKATRDKLQELHAIMEQAAPQAGEDCRKWAANVAVRIRSLTNYLEDKLPELPPAALEYERELLAKLEKGAGEIPEPEPCELSLPD